LWDDDNEDAMQFQKSEQERQNGPVSSQTPRIAIQTLHITANNQSINLDNAFLRSHQQYADRWGYNNVLVTEALDHRTAHWQKIPATLRLFAQGYDYVMWMDGDALVTNLSLSLQPWIDKMTQENTSWLFSGDTLLINSGQQIFKNNNFTKTLLAEVDALWFLCNPKKWPCFGLYDNFAFAAYLGGARRDGVPVLNHDGTKRGRRKFEKMRHCTHMLGLHTRNQMNAS
jgi:galactosyl transferase GMA12/MNN10 family